MKMGLEAAAAAAAAMTGKKKNERKKKNSRKFNFSALATFKTQARTDGRTDGRESAAPRRRDGDGKDGRKTVKKKRNLKETSLPAAPSSHWLLAALYCVRRGPRPPRLPLPRKQGRTDRKSAGDLTPR
jgi:hypothetical protein